MVYFVLLMMFYAITSLIESMHKIKGPKRKIFCFVLLLPIYILAAFRDVSVGNDTMMYLNNYLMVCNLSSLQDVLAQSRFEPAYLTFLYICSGLNMDYYIVQFLLSSFIYYSKVFHLFSEKNV